MSVEIKVTYTGPERDNPQLARSILIALGGHALDSVDVSVCPEGNNVFSVLIDGEVPDSISETLRQNLKSVKYLRMHKV